MKTTKNKIYNLTAKEAIDLLRSSKMANYKTNIELIKPSHGGNNHGGRKPGSKNKMPPWFKSFITNQFDPFVKRQEEFNQYVLDQFKKHGWTLNKIQTRLDTIVTKNNLKE